jgi:hypothetical protein
MAYEDPESQKLRKVVKSLNSTFSQSKSSDGLVDELNKKLKVFLEHLSDHE